MICPKCKSDKISVHPVTTVKTKRRGFIGWFMWILFSIMTVGLFLIIPLLTNSKTKSKTIMKYVCQSCGHHWNK